MNGKKEFGDYQTPTEFSDKVCLYLKNVKNFHPNIIIEPTCGLGNFLQSSSVFEAQKYYGIEINPEYCSVCSSRFQGKNVSIINADFFAISLSSLRNDHEKTLLIGNPPWATNGMLSSIDSGNLPPKSNFKGLKGVEAITGASNFDICEFMILKMIHEFSNTDTLIAMLCKTSVARNIFSELIRTKINYTSFDILEFDAKKVFGISTNACILVIQLSASSSAKDTCKVYSFDNPSICINEIGFNHGRLINFQAQNCTDYSGKCFFEWRQGVKHDCSSVMELTKKDGILMNGLNESVAIEDNVLFPLVKSSMFKKPIIHEFSKYVIVTQKKPRDNTSVLSDSVPSTWDYLIRHKQAFDARKSSVYLGAPLFSMFGIGDYSFAKYKVGLSGFYKKPLFCLLYSDDGKPVMTDDTSYFISFDDYDLAYTAMLLLNTNKVQQFIVSLAFLDSKRPFTKKLLNHIDFTKITSDLSLGNLQKTEDDLKLERYISKEIYMDFVTHLHSGQQTLPLDLLLNYSTFP